MLTGRAAELRPDINYLMPRITVLVAPEDARQPYAADGEYKETLAQSIHLFNRTRAEQHRARQVGRSIPTSGPGRRRAKAIRNRDAVAEMPRPLALHAGCRVVAFEYVRDEDEPVFVGC